MIYTHHPYEYRCQKNKSLNAAVVRFTISSFHSFPVAGKKTTSQAWLVKLSCLYDKLREGHCKNAHFYSTSRQTNWTSNLLATWIDWSSVSCHGSGRHHILILISKQKHFTFMLFYIRLQVPNHEGSTDNQEQQLCIY